jgi:hypothetical protein
VIPLPLKKPQRSFWQLSGFSVVLIRFSEFLATFRLKSDLRSAFLIRFWRKEKSEKKLLIEQTEFLATFGMFPLFLPQRCVNPFL